MGEHVVHLARDPGALGVAGLLDEQVLLGLGVAYPLLTRLRGARRRTCLTQRSTVMASTTRAKSAREQRVVIGLHAAEHGKHGELQSARSEPQAASGGRPQP